MEYPSRPPVVERGAWEGARSELLAREKAHTRAGDQLAAAHRRLPMTRMGPVTVTGANGPTPLREVFEGRHMLLVYETTARGVEAMLPTLQLLDLTAYGRQETWEDSPAGWPQGEAGAWWWRDGRPVAQWLRPPSTR